MSYSDIKITQADINENNVRSASDILIGNADDNKAVFDKLPEFIAGKHNDLVDALDEVSEHAQGDTEEIDRLSAEKVNVPKNGTDLDYGEAGQMLTTKGNGETQWEDAGQPTDEQTQNAINNWLDAHPEATTTVQDGSITEEKLNSALIQEINFTPSLFKFGGLDGVLSQGRLGTYTGDTVNVDSTLNISAYDTADQFKTIADTRFFLNADMLSWDSGFRSLPTFVNCVFWGNGHNIVADGKYIATAKFINCVFYNCGLIQNAYYVQSARFIGCRFAGTTDIINGLNCGDITFADCQGESDFKARLVNISASTNNNAVDHLRLTNCVFEGNPETDLIVFNKNATIDIDGCYFESYPQGILKATQGDSNSILNVSVSNVKTWNCGSPVFYVDSTYAADDGPTASNTVAVVFNSCRFAASVETDLLNRYNINRYSINDCNLDNVKADNVQAINSRYITFSESDGAISATIQLKPLHLYYAMQARATYTGFVLYAVMTTNSTIVTQTLFDTNNRWTVTDEGNLMMKITSGGFGSGRLVDMGRVG